jgi:ABC-2 type transport system ATP-binding protein
VNPVTSIISVRQLSKIYDNGFKALNNVELEVEEAEILALLGPNGAGKTTLISTICGIVNPTSGDINVAGFDIQKDYRKTRRLIGLVPQELHTESFESVWATVSFSRGLFGLPPNPAYIESILKDLSLWDKKDTKIMQLSGGMKRRLLIAKALSHEPKVLFLDEPTAGVDVELRKDMWKVVAKLRKSGVTIILTTHYIEEAEEIADRIAIINQGEIKLIEDKAELMRQLGKKYMVLELREPLDAVPAFLDGHNIEIGADGHQLIYHYDSNQSHTGIANVMKTLSDHAVGFKDLSTHQSSLEDIFVDLVKDAS